jgi:hypothetical protein
MTIYEEKYGFVYIWYDAKHKRYYIGSHWGTEDDGYICSSRLMRQAYNRRQKDFKRRIIERIYTNRKDLLLAEERWLSMIDPEKTTSKNTTLEERKNVRYYNINLGTQNHWWSDTDTRLTIGEKISKAKTGVSTGPCSEETKSKISKSNSGKVRTPEMKEVQRQKKLGKKRTEEAKRKTSESLRKHWEEGRKNGTRSVAKSKPKTMSPQEQAKQSSSRLKELWSDPIWAANQRKRLSEGAKKRPPRTEESKRKARDAQLGKPKKRKIGLYK